MNRAAGLALAVALGSALPALAQGDQREVETPLLTFSVPAEWEVRVQQGKNRDSTVLRPPGIPGAMVVIRAPRSAQGRTAPTLVGQLTRGTAQGQPHTASPLQTASSRHGVAYAAQGVQVQAASGYRFNANVVYSLGDQVQFLFVTAPSGEAYNALMGQLQPALDSARAPAAPVTTAPDLDPAQPPPGWPPASQPEAPGDPAPQVTPEQVVETGLLTFRFPASWTIRTQQGRNRDSTAAIPPGLPGSVVALRAPRSSGGKTAGTLVRQLTRGAVQGRQAALQRESPGSSPGATEGPLQEGTTSDGVPYAAQPLRFADALGEQLMANVAYVTADGHAQLITAVAPNGEAFNSLMSGLQPALEGARRQDVESAPTPTPAPSPAQDSTPGASTSVARPRWLQPQGAPPRIVIDETARLEQVPFKLRWARKNTLIGGPGADHEPVISCGPRGLVTWFQGLKAKRTLKGIVSRPGAQPGDVTDRASAVRFLLPHLRPHARGFWGDDVRVPLSEGDAVWHSRKLSDPCVDAQGNVYVNVNFDRSVHYLVCLRRDTKQWELVAPHQAFATGVGKAPSEGLGLAGGVRMRVTPDGTVWGLLYQVGNHGFLAPFRFRRDASGQWRGGRVELRPERGLPRAESVKLCYAFSETDGAGDPWGGLLTLRGGHLMRLAPDGSLRSLARIELGIEKSHWGGMAVLPNGDVWLALLPDGLKTIHYVRPQGLGAESELKLLSLGGSASSWVRLRWTERGVSLGGIDGKEILDALRSAGVGHDSKQLETTILRPDFSTPNALLAFDERAYAMFSLVPIR